MPAAAQTWPTKPVRFILPFGPGSGIDITARLLQDRLSSKWGQPIVIEHRPGGDALIAIGAFANAADDHVLLYASLANFLAHPYQHEKLPYNLARDIAPIARVSETVLSVSVPTALGINNLKELVARAHAEPGKLSGTSSAGIAAFTWSAFMKNEKIDIPQVPYRDAVMAPNDLSEGRLQVIFGALAAIGPQLKSGKVKVIAVSGNSRSPLAPEAPTAAEAGFPVLNAASSVGLFGPSSMSPELRARIGADVVAAASDPAFIERVTITGQAVAPAGAAAMEKSLQTQTENVAEIAAQLNMKRLSRE